MPSEPLTAERILEATEEVLRRHGPGKATVVDVARALGVSHGSVYRHFRTKAALREAVTQRWLDRTTAELQRVVDAGEDRPAPETLQDWSAALFAAKRHKAGSDPELFATYSVLLAETSEVVARHIEDLVTQVRTVVEQGLARGEFRALPGGLDATARAFFEATAHFHDPVHAPEWTRPGVDAAFTSVLDLLLRGLRTA